MSAVASAAPKQSAPALLPVRLCLLTASYANLSGRLISVFGHVARLDDVTPANMALQLHINVSLNRPPDRTWRRPPGRPRNKWLDQLRNDSTRPTVDMVVQRREGPRRLRELDDDDVLTLTMRQYG